MSLVADVLFDGAHTVVQGNGVLLKCDLLLVENSDFALEEVHLVDVCLLHLEEVFFEVGQVLDHLF